VLTGAGLRKRGVFFSVYTIANYVEEGAGLRSAADVVAADRPKRLYLVMERDVEGPKMAEAIIDSIHDNHPAPAFANEVATMDRMLRAQSLKKGDQVYLTNIPKEGLQVDLVGKKQFLVKNVAFSKAVWEIFLGHHCLDENLKKALIDRL